MSNDKALVPVEVVGLVRPVATAADVVASHKAVIALIQDALVDGEDYGVIPGTKRPTLLKPGAERLTIAFGAHAEYEVVEQEIDHDRPVKWSKKKWEWGQRRGEKIWSTETGESFGLYRYVMKCRLVRPDGRVIGEGMGTCSSLESKYVDRPRETENTILKMAKKRAHVDAVLSMAGLSDRFTQDTEEADPPGGGPGASNPAGSVHPPASSGNGGNPAAGGRPGGGQSPPTQPPPFDPKTGEVRPSERAQHVKIFAKATEAGYKTKAEVYDFMEKKIGHEIVSPQGDKSIKVLTYDEAETVYKMLVALVGHAGPPGPPEPPPSTDVDF